MSEQVRQALAELEDFLDGSKPLNGVWFGEPNPGAKGAFWWRKHMHEVFAAARSALSQPPEVKEAQPWPGHLPMTDGEQRYLMGHPEALALLRQYHDEQQAQADSMMDEPTTGNTLRREHLFERGRSIMAEDLDLWSDALRKEFGFPVEVKEALSGERPIVTEAMVTAYLTANDAYWRRVDDAPPRIGKWRDGTPSEATRVSLEAALAVAPTAASAGVPSDEQIAAIYEKTLSYPLKDDDWPGVMSFARALLASPPPAPALQPRTQAGEAQRLALALRGHVKTLRLSGRDDGMVEDMENAAAALAPQVAPVQPAPSETPRCGATDQCINEPHCAVWSQCLRTGVQPATEEKVRRD